MFISPGSRANRSRRPRLLTASRALGRNSAGPGPVEEVTLSQILDWIGSAARGDILFRGASAWQRLAAGTSGNVLQTNGAGADPSWVTPSGGGWTYIGKTSDESVTSSTTMQNDDVFSFAVAANTKYSMRMVLHVNSVSDVNNNFKYQFTGPASPTFVRIGHLGRVDTIGANASQGDGGVTGVATAFSTSKPCGNGVASTNGIYTIDFMLQNGANAGTVQLQWAQVNSSATATKVLAGSYMEWRAT